MSDDLAARSAFAADGPLHALLRRLTERAARAEPLPAPTGLTTGSAELPFLSVLTRTQGRRPETLRELMLCLAAQTCEDFEVLILAHDLPADRSGAVDAAIAEQPERLRSRVRRVDVTGGGRSRPLNIGLVEARGRYVVAVDDDDLVLAHWVAEFRQLAQSQPGRVLRAVVAEQDVAETPGVAPGHAAVSATRTPYPDHFDLLAHLVSNLTPNLGLAFPRECFTELGIRYDEALHVFEDWDVLLECAALCGVASTPEVTAVYRRWVDAGSSLLEAGEESWRAAERDVAARIDSRELLLPPGAFSALRWYKAEQLEYAAEHGRMSAARDYAEAELARVEALLAASEQRYVDVVRDFEESASWKLTAPVRRLSDKARRLRGQT
ncbi:MAG TPA: glycosyltransferase [Mycobacteriales bacterium]|nr:glycosyltransferase [Mycobacteriales bacterium]